MLSKTLEKFCCPKYLIKEYEHWILLCRFEQVTLGSLILICKDDVDAFSKISKESFSELSSIIPEIEITLKKLFQNDKINYLMLMMVDPEVHFHVIPRYETERVFEGITFSDKSWPKKTDISVINNVPEEIILKLTKKLQDAFA